VDFWHNPPVEMRRRLDMAPEADQRDAHSGSIQDPRLVCPGIKDRGGLADAIQNFSARTAPDGLRRH
jgi:hypothetical protein